MKKMNNKGFTLMEVLIVVAIIAVLVAIAIPVMTNQLEKAREAVDAANLRAAYAEVMSDLLLGDGDLEVEVEQKQTKGGWQHVFDFPEDFVVVPPTDESESWTVKWDADLVVSSTITGGVSATLSP
jgi:type IV pilus assembly protein PilA